ncbi:multidrug effflux MFS transporter [Pseudomonas chlororaphis]|uniref:multidrug effflux MFS transporter n=1 Tax=Pseudomonas chlororaphis TaxID=587753 RepID=UPI0015DE30F5|nr:multidrug effflux MFS transporter [Pseudomonas chlororaphis]QLL16412.1 multidrug effflux MFS transporter [Pseudomonas chlororaphis subsp. aurantiaca]
MNSRSFLVLTITLLMFPQVAQTLYSPALTDIGQTFNVGSQAASQILSVFFIGFALGVVVWGRISDRLGRRAAMLAGLVVYALGSTLALLAKSFEGLIVAQTVAAFGAAVGSVVTQTLLRDRYRGTELAHVYSIAGIALAASPAIGLFTGASLVEFYGYRGMLTCLLLLSLVLWAWCLLRLPETRPEATSSAPLLGTLGRMLKDGAIWRSAILVAVFNVALLSYYSLGPFLFDALEMTAHSFGYSGVLLALGSASGAWLNRLLLKRGVDSSSLVKIASGLMFLGALLVLLLQGSWLFVWPMLLVVLAFGMAIPNVLGGALAAYHDRLGTAGALFGLLYYLLIGAAMILVAWAQTLGWTILICSVVALLSTDRRRKSTRSV